MDPSLIRGLERIACVIFGGLAIYLGYRLFLALPEHGDSEGRFEGPGGISIYVSRVGPGVFFALFGAFVLYTSLRAAVQYEAGVAPSDEVSTVSLVRYQGVADEYDTAGRRAALGGIALDFRRLDVALGLLPESLGDLERADVDMALRNIKLRALETVWDSDAWGEFAAFQMWANLGASGAPPSGSEEAARIYVGGIEP